MRAALDRGEPISTNVLEEMLVLDILYGSKVFVNVQSHDE